MSLIGDLIIVLIAVYIGTKFGFDFRNNWYVWALIITAIILGFVFETDIRPIDDQIRRQLKG